MIYIHIVDFVTVTASVTTMVNRSFLNMPKSRNTNKLSSINQSINQLSKCLISVSTDSKAHHPVRKAQIIKTLDMFQVVPREAIRCSVVRSYGGNDF